jgi:uncharacterized RDD family membrane protein YckC
MDTEINSSTEEEKKKGNFKYPGCFKKSIAFLVDQLIIAVIGLVLLFPLSDFIGALYLHAWLPGYLIGAIYFMALESSISSSQSIGKRLFSMEVKTDKNNAISPQVSLGRYLLITLPFYNGAISNSIATTIGITNTSIGGAIFLIIVGLLFSGNTVFMLFHPQKRGLHDILFKSVVAPADSHQFLPVTSFTLKPILSGILGLVILGALFGNLFFSIGKNPDFADLTKLTYNIKKESGIENLNVKYRTFSMNGEQTMFAIEVSVPIHYNKFDDTNYTKELSEKLYPLVKKVNTNPKVDTVKIAFHAQKYIGAFPISKSKSTLKKMSET